MTNQQNPDIKFEMAAKDRVDALRPYVARVLNAVGHPDALVTDESMIRDFMPRIETGPSFMGESWLTKKLGIGPRRQLQSRVDTDAVKALGDRLGVALLEDGRDYVVDVAARLALAERAGVS